MTRQRPGFSRASSPAVSPTGSPARRRLEAAWSRRPRLSACHGFEARPRQPGAGKGRPRACRPVARSGRMAHVKKSSSCRQSLPSSLCHPNAQISIRLSRSEGASLWPKGSRISGMRDNWLSNRIFTSYENIIEHCCQAWNRLTDQPWRIMPIGIRKWANGF